MLPSMAMLLSSKLRLRWLTINKWEVYVQIDVLICVVLISAVPFAVVIVVVSLFVIVVSLLISLLLLS